MSSEDKRPLETAFLEAIEDRDLLDANTRDDDPADPLGSVISETAVELDAEINELGQNPVVREFYMKIGSEVVDAARRLSALADMLTRRGKGDQVEETRAQIQGIVTSPVWKAVIYFMGGQARDLAIEGTGVVEIDNRLQLQAPVSDGVDTKEPTRDKPGEENGAGTEAQAATSPKPKETPSPPAPKPAATKRDAPEAEAKGNSTKWMRVLGSLEAINELVIDAEIIVDAVFTEEEKEARSLKSLKGHIKRILFEKQSEGKCIRKGLEQKGILLQTGIRSIFRDDGKVAKKPDRVYRKILASDYDSDLHDVAQYYVGFKVIWEAYALLEVESTFSENGADQQLGITEDMKGDQTEVLAENIISPRSPDEEVDGESEQEEPVGSSEPTAEELADPISAEDEAEDPQVARRRRFRTIPHRRTEDVLEESDESREQPDELMPTPKPATVRVEQPFSVGAAKKRPESSSALSLRPSRPSEPEPESSPEAKPDTSWAPKIKDRIVQIMQDLDKQGLLDKTNNHADSLRRKITSFVTTKDEEKVEVAVHTATEELYERKLLLGRRADPAIRDYVLMHLWPEYRDILTNSEEMVRRASLGIVEMQIRKYYEERSRTVTRTAHVTTRRSY